MTSSPKMPAFAVYKSQAAKRTAESNSDDSGTAETPVKRHKTRQNAKIAAIKKTSMNKKPKVEKEATITVKEERKNLSKKKRGRPAFKKEPVVVDQEESEAENEEHSESNGEQSDEHSENGEISDTNVSETVDVKPFLSKISKTYSCGTEAAEEIFKWLINPVAPEHFYNRIFEDGPYYLLRHNPNYYGGLFGSSDFDKIMKENRLEYNKEIDVVAYQEEQRKTLDSGSIVYPDFVWDCYNNGYSIRMRNPQAYHQPLWQLCSLLQEHFSSCVGANMYLTPAFSQGFPPHYDDIDAFILQLEGKKLWRVYPPRKEDEAFPQISSPDLDQETLGEPMLEQEIKAGDMLYIPRGFIHQAQTTTEYSLHMTISTNQKNTWSDFIHHGLEAALEKATGEYVELRKSIPKDYFDFAGCATPQTDSSLDSKERCVFRKKAQKLAKKVLKHFAVDAAADAHAAHFIHGCMRPIFSKQEGMFSIHGNGNKFENGKVKKVSCLSLDSRVRWIRKRAFRLVMDEEGPKLFHTLGNGKNFKEVETDFLDVDETAVPAICALFKAHPEYIKVRHLPVVGNLSDKRQFAEILYYNGFLVTEKVLPPE